MKKLFISISLLGVLVVMASAQDTSAKMEKSAKAKAAAAPRTDAEVQSCINEKFKVSTSVKNGNAVVSDGTATLTGNAGSGGQKGGATRSAKACGAKAVINNIIVPVKPKAPKAADGANKQ